MEELAEINFIAALEGQEIERTMARIVSIWSFLFLENEFSRLDVDRIDCQFTEHPNMIYSL